MSPPRSVVRKESARSRRLERIVKGFASHRRIEILELLSRKPELSLGEISGRLEIELKTASEHLRRLTFAGLVLKRCEGRVVHHKVTPQAVRVLALLKTLV